jgi:hypothetical protein
MPLAAAYRRCCRLAPRDIEMVGTDGTHRRFRASNNDCG